MTQTTQAVSAGAAVALHGLRKRYGDVQAVADLDLVIAPGEVVALLGPNGAGKSTTVDMLLGLTRPDGGDARIFGQVPRAAVRAGTVGAMLQNGALRDQATVAETVGAIAALHGRAGAYRGRPGAGRYRGHGQAPVQQAVRGAEAAGTVRARPGQRP